MLYLFEYTIRVVLVELDSVHTVRVIDPHNTTDKTYLISDSWNNETHSISRDEHDNC